MVKITGESLQKEMEQLKVEKRDLQSSADNWKQEVSRLKELLAEKEQQVSRAVRSRQMETAAHMETLTLLSNTGAALEESRLSAASREEELCKQVTEAEESHRRELLENEERFNQQLQDKEHMRRRELAEVEDRFERELAEKEEKVYKQLLQHEELMKLLAEVCEHWEASTHNWAEKQKQLGEMIQKNTSSWKQMEAEYKQEVQHLREEILKLQGRPSSEGHVEA